MSLTQIFTFAITDIFICVLTCTKQMLAEFYKSAFVELVKFCFVKKNQADIPSSEISRFAFETFQPFFSKYSLKATSIYRIQMISLISFCYVLSEPSYPGKNTLVAA